MCLLGHFLSGGIDSSLITDQSQQKDPISSFTISFPDDNYAKNKFFNEAPYAKIVILGQIILRLL